MPGGGGDLPRVSGSKQFACQAAAAGPSKADMTSSMKPTTTPGHTPRMLNVLVATRVC